MELGFVKEESIVDYKLFNYYYSMGGFAYSYVNMLLATLQLSAAHLLGKGFTHKIKYTHTHVHSYIKQNLHGLIKEVMLLGDL